MSLYQSSKAGAITSVRCAHVLTSSFLPNRCGKELIRLRHIGVTRVSHALPRLWPFCR